MNIIKNAKLVALSGDQDPSVLIMDWEEYIYKLQKTINDGIRQGIYAPTIDTILCDLKKFKVFLRQNFNGMHETFDAIIRTVW